MDVRLSIDALKQRGGETLAPEPIAALYREAFTAFAIDPATRSPSQT
jgi:DNA/RNA-binding domain of Phe-tRNA-synthetase-like protein